MNTPSLFFNDFRPGLKMNRSNISINILSLSLLCSTVIFISVLLSHILIGRGFNSPEWVLYLKDEDHRKILYFCVRLFSALVLAPLTETAILFYSLKLMVRYFSLKFSIFILSSSIAILHYHGDAISVFSIFIVFLLMSHRIVILSKTMAAIKVISVISISHLIVNFLTIFVMPALYEIIF